MVTGTFQKVAAKSGLATGVGGAVTVTVMRELADTPAVLVIEYPTKAVPTKLLAGLNTTLLAEKVAVPLVGLTLAMEIAYPLGSKSLARAGTVTCTFAAVDVASGLADKLTPPLKAT